MNSNGLAVFAASLQCTDEAKVVSRGTPRSPVSEWLASAAEKDGERGGRFPKVRQEHLLGFIGKSYSTAQAQATEYIVHVVEYKTITTLIRWSMEGVSKRAWIA